MKVIGVGFGRTGTASLKQALEHLGVSPCYHMFDIKQQPDRAEAWIAAAKGRPVDWSEVFAGFNATVDWPGAAFWRELVAHYPDARVILTVRDSQRWYDSAISTIFKNSRPMQNPVQRVVFPLVARLSHSLNMFVQMANSVVVDRVFDGRIADREYAIKVFERHIAEVKAEVPADRLLVYRVTEGWEPLCEFLGVPVPEGVEFPRGNDADTFRRESRQRAWHMLLRPASGASRPGQG